MSDYAKIGIVGDFNPAFRSHSAISEALSHAAHHLQADIEVRWVPTETIVPTSEEMLERFDGLWAAPGSPYRSKEGALEAIRFARERDRPFIGT